MATNATSQPELRVKIQTPEGVIWEGTALAVSSKNSAGRFDVLPEHINMITLIERQPVIILTHEGEQSYTFERTLISVQKNTVSLYADIAITGTPTNLVDKKPSSR